VAKPAGGARDRRKSRHTRLGSAPRQDDGAAAHGGNSLAGIDATGGGKTARPQRATGPALVAGGAAAGCDGRGRSPRGACGIPGGGGERIATERQGARDNGVGGGGASGGGCGRRRRAPSLPSGLAAQRGAMPVPGPALRTAAAAERLGGRWRPTGHGGVVPVLAAQDGKLRNGIMLTRAM